MGTPGEIQALQQRLEILSSLTNRALLAAKLGKTFSGQRDLYKALGWKVDLTTEDYLQQYSRQDIAAAIVNKPVEASWRGGVSVVESGEQSQTPFEKQWLDLMKNQSLKLLQKLMVLDKMACLGSYAILYLGFDDITRNDLTKTPLASGAKKLLFIRSFKDSDVEIKKWDDDPKSARFGLPLLYEIELSFPMVKQETKILVHYTRVIHVANIGMDSDVIGEPVLKNVFNRLTDLEKLVGGSAEMFWGGARPGYHGKVNPEFAMDDDTEKDLKKQIDEYESNLRRILLSEGVDLQALAVQVADPKSHVDVQIEMISAATGIPKRILVGSERGELSSQQDETAWKELIQGRRINFIEVQILRPLVAVLVKTKNLPEFLSEYTFEWSDLFAPSEKEKAEVGKVRAEALRAYVTALGADMVVPPEAFFEFMLGLNQEQINLITAIMEKSVGEEKPLVDEEDEDV